MTEVDRLLREYIEQYRAGDADPTKFVAALEGTDRKELEALIDAYLVRAPRRAWDPAAYAGSQAEQIVESLDRSLQGAAGAWPALLPRLRARAQLKRSDVVQRLAEALGVGDRQEKVGRYYHEMEQGLLPAADVSPRVLDALGEIVGQSADALRRAGAALGPGGGEAGEAAVFARKAYEDPEYSGRPSPPTGADRPGVEEWDEVDQLFRGG